MLLSSGYLYAQSEACTRVINDGTALFKSGKYAEAKKKFESAKTINCNDAQSWIDKCNAQLQSKSTSTSAKPSSTKQCEDNYNNGMKEYNNEEYETALMWFEKGLREKCSNFDFQFYIDMCERKIGPRAVDAVPPRSAIITEEEIKARRCNEYLDEGQNAYNVKNYPLAKYYFQYGLESNCNNAIFQQWITNCDNKIAEQNATLTVSPTEIEFDATGGNRTINITTNVSSWTHSTVLSWLSINKYSSYITLTCNPNTTTNDRNDYFTINAGTKSVRINIKQKGQVILDLTEVYRLISLNMNSNPTSSWDSGSKYKGQKNNDVRSGLGAYYWNSGEFYFGDWSNSKESGHGIYIVSNGYQIPNCPSCQFYVGNHLNGDKSGMGTCYDKTGKLIYYGDFANDRPTGAYPSVSDLSSYKFEIIKHPSDGTYYLGETKDGKRHGLGFILWKDGGMWYGEWKDGTRAGSGIHIFLNGSMTSGTWAGNNYSE